MHTALLGSLPWLVRPAGDSAASRSPVQVRLLEPPPLARAAAAEAPIALPPPSVPPAEVPVAATAKPSRRMVGSPTEAKADLQAEVAGRLPAAVDRPADASAATPPPEPAVLPQTPPQAAEAAASTPIELSDRAPTEAAPVLPPTPPVGAATALVEPDTSPPPVAADFDREVPVYRTLIPPPVTLRYQIRRGALSGSGEFQWAPAGDRYEARLDASVAGIKVISQRSLGGFDEAGVAPLRFTDQRVTGAVHAANFQRDLGKITFSGPSVEHPLLMGSQDRLSWMVQLGAVVSAEPRRLQPGGKVVIYVVGARGDARLWIFKFAAQDTVLSGAGAVIPAARFVRETADPYDTRVEVWLDPRRHHLPARALMRSGPEADVLELLVQDAAAP